MILLLSILIMQKKMIFSTTFPAFFLCFVDGISAWLISRPTALQTVRLGESVTVECFLPKNDFNIMIWYKQELGMVPEPVANCHNRGKKITFLDGFNNKRFEVSTDSGVFHLTITETKNDDAAIYFCGVISVNELQFGSGTLLIIKGEKFNNQTIVQNPVEDLLYPGDNVTLNCFVRIVEPDCSEDHRVYWFRDGSVEPHPGIIYTHVNSDDQCKNSSETDSTTQSCVYKLPKTNLSLSDTGTYYCAVAACGEILFGNGTKLNIADKNLPETTSPTYLTLVSLNIISALVMIAIVAICCKNRKPLSGSSNCQAVTHSLDTQVASDETLNYAALSFNNKPQSSGGTRRQQILRSTEVYSKIKYNQQS